MSELSYLNKDYFKPLTGVRCIAAYLVYIHNYNPFHPNVFGTNIVAFTEEFHIGVTLFFVLSGFLIAHRYMDIKHFSWRNYFVNRFARIYPIYFLLTIFTFIFSTYALNVEAIQSIKLFFLNITFLKGFSDHLKFSGISPAWSLTVEETFYIMAPIIFLLIKRNTLFLILLPVFFIPIGMALVFIFSTFHINYFFENLKFIFSYTFFGRCTEFFSGIALSIFLKRNNSCSKGFKYTAIGFFVIIVSIILISLVKGNEDFGIKKPWGIFINNTILPLFGVTVFYYGLIVEKTCLSKILESRLFVLLGKSSYIFYLIHYGFISAIIRMYFHNYVLIFILINIVSIILFKIVEEPMNLFLRRKFRKEIVVTSVKNDKLNLSE